MLRVCKFLKTIIIIQSNSLKWEFIVTCLFFKAQGYVFITHLHKIEHIILKAYIYIVYNKLFLKGEWILKFPYPVAYLAEAYGGHLCLGCCPSISQGPMATSIPLKLLQISEKLYGHKNTVDHLERHPKNSTRSWQSYWFLLLYVPFLQIYKML